ncbi:MAG: alcohol dehydrogenase catalytic domain-containing protein [Myxococcota bacterium]
MKGLVFNGPRDVRYEDYDDPTLVSPNSAIVKVDLCSICGSDLHIYHGDHIGSTDYGSDAPRFCVGHEFTGEVVEIGPDVHQIRKGDRVFAAGGTGCGRCGHCRTGNDAKCRAANAFGLSPALNGGQAEYVCVPNADHTLYVTPEGVDAEQAVLLTDAMATCHFGVTRTGLESGDTFAVVGLGPIGLIGVELAQILGASRVFAIDPVAERRAHAERLGATTFAPGAEAVGQILEATRGGVKRVFEASGAKAAVEGAIAIAGRGAMASFIGLPQPDVVLPLMALLYKDIGIRAGVANVTAQWPHLIPLVQSGRLKAEGLFSHRMPLSEGTEAYRRFDAREDGVVKIMLEVG